MKKKILLFCALAVMAMNFSSCIVREHDGHRHWHHHHHDDATIIVR